MSNWNILTEAQKREFARNLVQRRREYEAWHCHRFLNENKDILLIADQPGPGAPKTDDYHHTPFYAKTYSGGWLNSLLVEAGIHETRLFWENSADRHGVPRDPLILKFVKWEHVFVLGNNAEKWLTKNISELRGISSYEKFLHPQAHKRWNSKQPYGLIDRLKELSTR